MMTQQDNPSPRMTAKNLAERAHTRRVAAWCAEIAAKLNLPAAEQKILERAALLHQRSKLFAEEAAWSGLARELGMAPNRVDETSEAAIEALKSLHGYRPASERIRNLAMILEQCDDLDSACELDATVSSEPDLNGLDGIVAVVAGYFGAVTSAELERASSRLPVFSGIVYKALALLGNENTNLGDLESLICADQTLAGHIIGAANSVLMGSAIRVKSIRPALVRLGTEAARRIVSAASLRKMFESKRSHTLWNHSLDVAESAAGLARRSGLVDPEEAFLAGLMHDVGRLVISNLPAAVVAQQERLTEKGCPDPIVERVILGEDHAAIGARVLQRWRFAENLIAAVERHHTPEQSSSPLCSVLYLAEVSAGQDGGLESAWRYDLARKNLWLPASDTQASTGSDTVISGLRFAVAA